MLKRYKLQMMIVKKTHELYEKDGKWSSKIVDFRKA